MQPTGHAYEHLYKYEIVGEGPSGIGTAESFWLSSAGGELEFVGVRTDAFEPFTHVIPANVLDIDEAHRTITVPYTPDFVRAAPHFGPHDGITEADRERIYSYYGTKPRA